MKVAVLCGMFCMTAPALRAAPPQVGGSLTLSSNYLLRGVSRSSNDAAVSGEAHVQFKNGLFGSLWASTSRPRVADETSAEVGAIIGWSLPLGDSWSARLSAAHYESPWSSRVGFYRYDEISAQLRYLDRWFLDASFSPNTSRYAPLYGPVWNRKAASYEASFQQPLASQLHAFAGIGYYDLSALFDEGYWYGSVGMGWSGRRWSLEVSAVLPGDAARRLSYANAAEKRVLATLSFQFF